jgi:DNA repair exonuclease SbcCD ATPase subunit
MYNDFNRGYNDQEARQVFNDECRNAEKCSVCGQERYGHHEEHNFKAKWEDVDISDAQDIMKEIKKERKDNE